ncbi:hypothetical protein [Shewanella surugensis]|uniref:Transglutaminase domain-containing protein n=1 Tax=Shewanella surugensis TaxID=212020 RepID=A0ABT0LJA3_9GAMM|nr:hypothetical protein [Shewanella surugensis]MCL1127674.1 hypothetical protein [Shewanella surugensis]
MNIYDEAKAFRAALQVVVLEGEGILDTLDGAEPLKNFPSGSCGVVSNLFAYYLCQSGLEANEISVVVDQDSFHSVKTHAWVQLGNKYIDLTASQFPEITDKEIVVQDSQSLGWLVSLKNLAESQDNGHVYINHPELHTDLADFEDLYEQVTRRIVRT